MLSNPGVYDFFDLRRDNSQIVHWLTGSALEVLARLVMREARFPKKGTKVHSPSSQQSRRARRKCRNDDAAFFETDPYKAVSRFSCCEREFKEEVPGSRSRKSRHCGISQHVALGLKVWREYRGAVDILSEGKQGLPTILGVPGCHRGTLGTE
ncbi:hypothetical protein LIA77_07742 [Sarocladium implicatum]|nr:hypothetical protein LIA77_07742 [Sarocladium implicatum]